MDQRIKDIEQFTQYLQRQYPQRRTAIDYTSDVRQFSLACSKPSLPDTFMLLTINALARDMVPQLNVRKSGKRPV